jgi:hypothetical protein
MDTTIALWSDQELAVARGAFDQACARAAEVLIAAVQRQAGEIQSLEALWQLHDFLSIQRHAIEGRSAFSLDGILFVFASFVKEGVLQLDDLQGLDAEKLSKVAAMASF